MTAVGIGKISCNFVNDFGFERLVHNLKDINPDVIIVESSHQECKASGPQSLFNPHDGFRLKIIIGDREFISDSTQFQQNTDDVQIPVITAVISPWQGLLHVLREQERCDFDFLKLDDSIINGQEYLPSEGLVLSSCFMGALVSIEVVKKCLNIGT